MGPLKKGQLSAGRMTPVSWDTVPRPGLWRRAAGWSSFLEPLEEPRSGRSVHRHGAHRPECMRTCTGRGGALLRPVGGLTRLLFIYKCQGRCCRSGNLTPNTPSLAPPPSDSVPAPKQCLRLAGQGLCGTWLLRDALPLPQPVCGRGLLGPRATAHGRDPLQVQQVPGKDLCVSLGVPRLLLWAQAPGPRPLVHS